MTTRSPDICPFGTDLQKYWNRRHKYFSKFDEGIQIDAEGLYSVTPEEIGAHQASLIRSTTVLDGFACVGGNAIAFARAGKKVIAVELSSDRIDMAKVNADIYGVGNDIDFIEGDFFDVAPTVKASAVYLDPPWGGPSYNEKGVFLLENFEPDGNKILKLALELSDEVIIKVPLIFDVSEIDRYSKDYQVYEDITKGRVISRTVVIRKPKV